MEHIAGLEIQNRFPRLGAVFVIKGAFERLGSAGRGDSSAAASRLHLVTRLFDESPGNKKLCAFMEVDVEFRLDGQSVHHKAI